MIHAFNQFTKEVEQGIDKKVVQLPLQQEKLASIINFGKRTKILVAGMPGSGKTSIVDSMYVLDIYRWWLKNRHTTDIKPFWIYRSMERSKTLKIAKWTAYLIWKDRGVLVDVPTLLGWSNRKHDLTSEHKKIIDSYKPFFEEFQDYCKIIDGIDHPTGVMADAEKFANEKGITKQIDKYNKIYTPHNENEIVFHITDHIGKLKKEKSFGTYLTDKGVLDLDSNYKASRMRDFYSWSVLDIMQLGRTLENTYRQVNTELDITPADFKGSGNPYEDADIAIGLLNPYKLQAYDHMGYDVRKFVNNKGYNRFRSLKVIKNSYGIDDVKIGYLFHGEVGGMTELPRSDEMTEALYNNYMK